MSWKPQQWRVGRFRFVEIWEDPGAWVVDGQQGGQRWRTWIAAGDYRNREKGRALADLLNSMPPERVDAFLVHEVKQWLSGEWG